MRCPPPLRPWVLTLSQSDSHPCTLIPSYLRTAYLPNLQSSSIRAVTDSATQDSTQNAALIMPHIWMYSKKCSDSHYQIMYIVREHKHCPRTSVSYNQRVWSFLQTLSLSLSLSPRNSCSNELNHTSDAAKDHDHGYKLSATELLNLFLSFYPTLLASSQHCRPPIWFDPSIQKRQNSKAPLLLPLTSTHYPPHNLSIPLQIEALSHIRHKSLHRLPPIWFDPPAQSPCILLHASKPPFFINAARSLIIIRSRHPDSMPIQCSRHRSSTKVLPMQM
jgi:hypothetical protein